MTGIQFGMTVYMRNKFVGHTIAFLLFFFLFTGKAFAEIHFEVTPLYSLKNGCLNEFVFYNIGDEWYKLSELNWNIKNISYLGGNIAFNSKYIRIEAGVSGGFSKESAKMYDSDWLNLPAAPDMKTTFSISENTLDSNINFNTKATFFYSINNWFKPGIFIEYTIDEIQFSARNGYGWYGDSTYSQIGQYVPFDSEYAKFFGVGSLFGINYLRVTKFLNIGLSCSFYILDRIQIKIEAGISPYLSVHSIDHHHNKGNFRDEIKSSFSLNNFCTDVRFNLFNNIYLGCSFLYNYFGETKGITYTNPKRNDDDVVDFSDLDNYYLETSYLSGASGKWYTFTAYCSYVF